MGDYVFPDAAKVVAGALVAAGVPAKGWLQPEDLSGRPVAHVQDMGGTQVSVFRTDRILVDVYETGRDAARKLAERVSQILVDKSHETEHGVIDRVTVEVVPTFEPYPSDIVAKYNAVYRAESRPI